MNIDDRPKCKTSNYKALRKNRKENPDELGFDDEMSETEKALSKKQKIGKDSLKCNTSALWKTPLREWTDKPYAKRNYF